MESTEPREVGREVVYDGRKVRLEVRQIEEPGGRRAVREIICHNGSVAILALREGTGGSREVLLERNYRYTVGAYVPEIPAGTLDRPGEDPADCARRELEEETGYRGGRWRKLMTMMPSPGFLTERLAVYVAEDVEAGEAQPEAGELIRVEWVAWESLLRMIREGEVEDAKTIAAVLYFEAFGEGTR